ncbi:hypothetical protein PGTUg99_015556 [Puccinia graminis f. sp. tritici]|uniref:Uncharacterized protein n=1 Tax=Puccinia graminis f. sp. tritici TaxID=56615 RepID=A0A5B0R4M2_PUCGR|nr:hypothetical protein PGTUg99_015556 [Puccinia graminis f. sp. tritici]
MPSIKLRGLTSIDRSSRLCWVATPGLVLLATLTLILLSRQSIASNSTPNDYKQETTRSYSSFCDDLFPLMTIDKPHKKKKK